MTLPLTETQERLWRFIRSCDRSPTYDEMAMFLGYSSKSPVKVLVDQLKDRGFVDYTPHKARTLRAFTPETDLSSFSTPALAAELARRLGA